MKVILAIGGAVIKTAYDEVKEVVNRGMTDVLIHNGGSLFHDFQRTIDKKLQGRAYYTLDEMNENYADLMFPTSDYVWEWVRGGSVPQGSLSELAYKQGNAVLLFTAPGCDFWQLGRTPKDWEDLSRMLYVSHNTLKVYIIPGDFHFICMGSAVIHPEIFKSVLAMTKCRNFKADVVDFLEMYRPRTRVAKYGEYFKMNHREYLKKVLNGEIKW